MQVLRVFLWCCLLYYTFVQVGCIFGALVEVTTNGQYYHVSVFVQYKMVLNFE